MKEALRKLEKYRIIECFEVKIRKQIQESNENTRRKYYKFWRINNNIKKDLGKLSFNRNYNGLC